MKDSFQFFRPFLVLLMAVGSSDAWMSSPMNPARQSSRHAITTAVTHAAPVTTTSALYSDRFNRDLEERSNRKAQGQGTGGMAAGAILGGLVLGPFGALFGANIGAGLGQKNALEKARQEEMERMGVSQDLLDAAQDVGLSLQQASEGLTATKESLNTQQSLARRLDADANEIYEKAKVAMTNGDEDTARDLLFKKTQTQDKLKKVLKNCAEDKKRFEIMEENVKAIEAKALEIESILQRTIGAKARQDSSTMSDFSLAREDPLLQKFNRDMGLD